MASDRRLAVIIFSILVTALGGLVLADKFQELRRPRITRVVVVSATADDPVFRTGVRVLSPDDNLTLAVALQVTRRWGVTRWYAPGAPLVIGDQPVSPNVTTSWPEDDRELRVFWFSLESPTVGGVQTPSGLARAAETRPILAPEMGRGMVAAREPEASSAGGLAPLDGAVDVAAGTYRLYARAEVSVNGSLKVLQAAVSPGADDSDHPLTARISRRLGSEWGLNPEAGELFRLPSIEPALDGSGDPAAVSDLVARRKAVSSRSFALAASPLARTVAEPTAANRVVLTGAALVATLPDGRPVAWSSEVVSGSILRSGVHWLVAVSDDGNGRLDGRDLVAQAWRRPAAIVPLASAVEPDSETYHLVTPPVEPGAQ